MMRHARHSLVAMILLTSIAAAAAEIPKLSPAVLAFVRVQAPTVTLTHVRIIDGTGKPAIDDRNLVIEHGRISRIEVGANAATAPGTTVVDLRGYSVFPGLVGMHNHLYYIARPNFQAGRTQPFDPPLLAAADV